MMERTGAATPELLERAAPSSARRARGPVAVVECFQSIPCNPCYTFCPAGAMKPLTDITMLPEVDSERCVGCGVCVSHCPGLAIFVVDESGKDGGGVVRLPYEFTPLPETGEYVTAVDREGKPVCRAQVVRIQNEKTQDRTPVVWLKVPKPLTMEVRFFRREAFYDDKTVVCRCEELTLGELRELIRQGYRTPDEIKRVSRAGMGPCQGRTCRLLILQEAAKMTGVPPADIPVPTFRPPVKPIPLGLMLREEELE